MRNEIRDFNAPRRSQRQRRTREKGTPLEKLLSKMESGDKAIVSIYTKDAGYHAVLIDDVIDGRVIIRDPLPINQGSSYSVTIEELEKLFKKNAVIIKK